jgi:hypothetical protein
LETFLLQRHIQIGSFSARAFFESRADAVVLNEMFKETVRAPNATPVHAEIFWRHAPTRESFTVISPDRLRVAQIEQSTWQVESELLSARLKVAPPLIKIFLESYPHTLPPLEWRVHVSTVFHKLLMLLGRVYLHAGGVQMKDGAYALVGEKGSGKSTTCLQLGRAGATILSDDHILIRRSEDEFYASGCEQVARVTAETEAALIPQTLTMEPRDFAGTLKKEFAVSDWFKAMPYCDVPLRKIFFPHVGTRWQVRELSTLKLTARLLETTHSSYRFANKEDYARHLAYFSALAQSVEGFEIELSPDLSELTHLVTFLQA